MQTNRFNPDHLTRATREFYRHALVALRASNVPFLVCGSCALEIYTGVGRQSKDLDIFVCKTDCERVLAALSAAGYSTERVFPHWLAKVSHGDDFIDIIFGSGNGVCMVDESWFEHPAEAEVLGVSVPLCPPEEIIWQQSFVMERERFDGADVVHLLRARARHLDWERLVWRFDRHWRVLLSHLILFGFVYPSHRCEIPEGVVRELLDRVLNDRTEDARICQGPLLSRAQYLVDIERWGYQDARLQPIGNMTPDQIQIWTAPILDDAPAELLGERRGVSPT